MQTNDILSALGETEEYATSNRMLLPKGGYLMTISLGEDGMGVTGENQQGEVHEGVSHADGSEIPKGNSPFVKLTMEVSEGPFAGKEISPRIYLTPGAGKNIAFINSMVKAITGKPVDTSAIQEFGFKLEGNNGEEIQQSFREQFLRLEAEDRVNFMAQYARVEKWDGSQVVVMLDHEKPRTFVVTDEDGNEVLDETTNLPQTRTVQYNSLRGYYPLSHAKKGRKWIANHECPRQVDEAAALEV